MALLEIAFDIAHLYACVFVHLTAYCCLMTGKQSQLTTMLSSSTRQKCILGQRQSSTTLIDVERQDYTNAKMFKK